MSQNQKKTTKTKNQTSTPNSTVKGESEKLAPTVMESIAEMLREMRSITDGARERQKPIEEFHRAVQSATASDLRLYWDVRIVRGVDTPFARSQGTSTLPGLLSPKMKGHAPSMIQQEVMDKIAQPLTSTMMEEAELQNAGQMAKIASQPMIQYAEDVDKENTDNVLDLAQLQSDEETDQEAAADERAV